MKKKKPIRLTKRAKQPGASDVPMAPVFETVETDEDVFDCPFPLSYESQRRLLNFLETRKSGIVTRSELMDVIFPVRTIN
jgi:hypothetical protein